MERVFCVFDFFFCESGLQFSCIFFVFFEGVRTQKKRETFCFYIYTFFFLFLDFLFFVYNLSLFFFTLERVQNCLSQFFSTLSVCDSVNLGVVCFFLTQIPKQRTWESLCNTKGNKNRRQLKNLKKNRG